MHNMPMDIDRQFMHNKFWLDGQISFTFEPPRDNPIDNLHLEDLQLFLKAHGFVLQDMPRPDAMVDEKQEQTSGIYIFPSPSTTAPDAALTVQVVGFFPLSTLPHTGSDAMESTSAMKAMPDMNGSSEGAMAGEHQKEAGSEPKPISTPGPIPTLVNLINNPDILNKLRAGGLTVTVDGVEKNLRPIPITSAAPNWLCGATHQQGPIGQGCPLTPPIPVPTEATCSDSSGLWPITLPDLPADLKPMTGDGVTVFVLDTLPKREQITRAAEAAEEHNMLLLDLDSESNTKFYYPPLADQLDLPGPARVETGKDINGKSIGFRMPDHGLFVAGIIHDIAPNANIECIRILNDFCVGSVQQIIDTLNKTLLPRLSLGGDLYGKPVVINMSLVIPDNIESLNAGIANQNVLDIARTGLLTAISSIISLGATFVASAGNEGDQRYKPMTTTRPEALYPAAFAYDGLTSLNAHRMIPVGAVDKDGNVTGYSCYSGVNGVATYGGNLPVKGDIYQDDEGMTRLKNIDGVIGVYTQLSYPALAYEDPEPTYPAPNGHGWAYWVGTSFATPIVSAVVARMLELKMCNPQSPSVLVPGTLASAAATGQVMWTNLTPATTPASSAAHGGSSATEIAGAIIKAVQCKPSHHMHTTEEGEQEVEVNVTEVNFTKMPVLVVEDGQHEVLEN